MLIISWKKKEETNFVRNTLHRPYWNESIIPRNYMITNGNRTMIDCQRSVYSDILPIDILVIFGRKWARHCRWNISSLCFDHFSFQRCLWPHWSCPLLNWWLTLRFQETRFFHLWSSFSWQFTRCWSSIIRFFKISNELFCFLQLINIYKKINVIITFILLSKGVEKKYLIHTKVSIYPTQIVRIPCDFPIFTPIMDTNCIQRVLIGQE